MSLLLVLSPNLKTSSMKTSRLLEDIRVRFETLLLNLPLEMEEELMELAKGSLSADEFIDEARRRRVIPEPLGAWEYSARPMLEALPRIEGKFPGLSTRCYGSSEREFASVNAAVMIAKLTLRTALRGSVEVEEWRETLLQTLEKSREAREVEAEAIMERVGRSSVCVSDMGGRGLRKSLKNSGIHVKIQYVERPYHFTPLMVLERMMALGPVEDEEVERLVRSHLEYIRRYVYRFDNRDRAHYEWTYDKVPWLRKKIEKEEIAAIDSIIHQN
ncbi:hypothetical protein MCGE09_00343 [Thaumarchaeota archaeon SCGC AB-539-E09]|nr:hypothetical protein MCGE09_00343 [Thaumarchaeota archaeon SCGC AB-539-E09]